MSPDEYEHALLILFRWFGSLYIYRDVPDFTSRCSQVMVVQVHETNVKLLLNTVTSNLIQQKNQFLDHYPAYKRLAASVGSWEHLEKRGKRIGTKAVNIEVANPIHCLLILFCMQIDDLENYLRHLVVGCMPGPAVEGTLAEIAGRKLLHENEQLLEEPKFMAPEIARFIHKVKQLHQHNRQLKKTSRKLKEAVAPK